ncbi:Ankyrin repeat-containing domain protein [Naviculisporaceae sp. PSN 640]
MANLNELPAELVLDIIEKYNRLTVQDIAALARTSRRLFLICNEVLYKQACRPEHHDGGIVPLAWGACRGEIRTMINAIRHGADPHSSFEWATYGPPSTPPWRWKERPRPRTNGSDEFVGHCNVLHMAAAHGHLDIIKLSLLLHNMKGLDINKLSKFYCSCQRKDCRGQFVDRLNDSLPAIASPLHLALCGNHLTAATFLVEMGASSLMPEGGHSRRDHYCDDAITPRALPEGMIANHPLSPLFLAAYRGNHELLQAMFERGASRDLVRARDGDGATVLDHAMRGKHSWDWKPTASFILKQRDADINQTFVDDLSCDSDRCIRMYYDAKAGGPYTARMRRFIHLGADIDYFSPDHDRINRTLLFLTVERGQLSFGPIERLLNLGANVHLAQPKRKDAIFDFGTSIRTSSFFITDPPLYYETPLHIALENELLGKYEQWKDEPCRGCEMEHLLVHNTEDPEFYDKVGLVKECQEHRPYQIFLLRQPILHNDAAHRAQYLHYVLGQTARHRLSSSYIPVAPIVKALLAAGADPTAVDHRGNTPLSLWAQVAVKRRDPSDPDCEIWNKPEVAADFIAVVGLLLEAEWPPPSRVPNYWGSKGSIDYDQWQIITCPRTKQQWLIPTTTKKVSPLLRNHDGKSAVDYIELLTQPLPPGPTDNEECPDDSIGYATVGWALSHLSWSTLVDFLWFRTSLAYFRIASRGPRDYLMEAVNASLEIVAHDTNINALWCTDSIIKSLRWREDMEPGSYAMKPLEEQEPLHPFLEGDISNKVWDTAEEEFRRRVWHRTQISKDDRRRRSTLISTCGCRYIWYEDKSLQILARGQLLHLTDLAWATGLPGTTARAAGASSTYSGGTTVLLSLTFHDIEIHNCHGYRGYAI